MLSVPSFPILSIICFLDLKLGSIHNFNLYFLDSIQNEFIKYLFFLHVECHSMSLMYLHINIVVLSCLFLGSLYKVILICCYIY